MLPSVDCQQQYPPPLCDDKFPSCASFCQAALTCVPENTKDIWPGRLRILSLSSHRSEIEAKLDLVFGRRQRNLAVWFISCCDRTRSAEHRHYRCKRNIYTQTCISKVCLLYIPLQKSALTFLHDETMQVSILIMVPPELCIRHVYRCSRWLSYSNLYVARRRSLPIDSLIFIPLNRLWELLLWMRNKMLAQNAHLRL